MGLYSLIVIGVWIHPPPITNRFAGNKSLIFAAMCIPHRHVCLAGSPSYNLEMEREGDG